MIIRKLSLTIAFGLVIFICNSQQQTFVLPANTSYAPGVVMAKVKTAYKDEFAGSSSARVKSLPIKGLKPMVHPALAKKGAAWRGPLAAAPRIDISQYFKITFDPSKDIESYINQLYQTGYFEIVEPYYLRKYSFVTNDPSVASQYYLTTIKAIQAWDITKGDPNLTIAIVDTGGNLTHPDLSGNLYTNTKDPVNGVDDDGDGYIDNWRGWDFMGADTLNAQNPNFIGDNDPSVFQGGEISHGTWVAGCASASTNNGIGIAGVGFNTKLMFTKHTADNQKTTNGGIYFGYDGILYAANQGIKIINCSWGGTGASQIEQDLINHITYDLGSLLVAAAGNGGNNTPSYPGAYDNVLSAAATDSNDKAASFTTYGPTVKVSAPGVNIYSTQYKDTYGTVSGTSFSSPITAGAAALVWAMNPTWTPLQVSEQIRVSSDASALYTANKALLNNLGHGRLDIQAALTTSLPSVRASNAKFVDASGFVVQPGETGFLTFDFTNYLKPTSSNITVTLSSLSTFVKVTQPKVSPGIIGMNQVYNNSLSPFQITLQSTVPENSLIIFTLSYSDGSYTDTQLFQITVNPSYFDINSNQITTTITEIGRLGYQDPSGPDEGSGFIFNQKEMLSEISLMMGTSATNLYNNARAGVGAFDNDFVSTIKIKQIKPGLRSYSEDFGEFSNSTTVSSQALKLDYRSLVWKDAPYDKFVIFEYKVTNPTSVPIQGFYFGMFADWDITSEGQLDAANWYPNEKMGYVYPAQSSALPYAGTQLLTGPPVYYALDNNPPTSNPSGFYVNDGFTDTEKFTTLSTNRLTAGGQTSNGDDVSHVVSSGPYNIAAGQTITIAYALHAANNFEDLKASSAYADTLYNHTLKASKPVADTITTCFNSPATISATGASTLKWYKTFTGGTSFFTGNQFTTGLLTSDTTFYVANADSSFESVRTPAVVLLRANPKITASGATTFCDGQSITLSVATADSYLWSTKETTQSIVVSTTGKFAVSVTDKSLGCSSSSDTVRTVVNQVPTAKFSVSPDWLIQSKLVTFTDQSTGAISWFWKFGDGATSTIESPTHTYTTINNFTATLVVTNSESCQSTATALLDVVTGLEEPQGVVSVYPNPIHGQPLVIEFNEANGTPIKINMLNLLGESFYQQDLIATGQLTQHEVGLKNFPDGIYILRVNAGDRFVTKKIIKAD